MCETCGTPFGTLFQDPPSRPAVEPGRATALSLLFPGIGHMALGRVGEGLARAVVFAWVTGTGIAILIMRRDAGLGPFLPLVAVLLLSGVATYVLTAVDARRAVDGQPPYLTTRIMMYGVSGLMVMTVLIIMITGLRARGG